MKVGEGLTIDENGVLSAPASEITPCAHQANLGNDPTFSDIVRGFNSLLKAMQDVGLMATE